jgi:hypothetical protein
MFCRIPLGALGMADEPGKLVEIIRHQGDVGSFNGRVAASCAHGDAKAGPAMAGASLTPSPAIATVP